MSAKTADNVVIGEASKDSSPNNVKPSKSERSTSATGAHCHSRWGKSRLPADTLLFFDGGNDRTLSLRRRNLQNQRVMNTRESCVEGPGAG